MKNDVMKNLKLPSGALDAIAKRLQELVLVNANVTTLAYSGMVSSGPRCGCKGSCDGGCTSW